MQKRYKIKIEYEGTSFFGWQKQPNAITVQKVIEDAITKAVGESMTTYASGRTDAGVHALGQVAHFDCSDKLPKGNLLKAINYHLKPLPVVILDIEEVDMNFHARFSAKERSYLYKIVNRPHRLCIDKNRAWHVYEELDANLMQEGANYLIGKHDLSSFRSVNCESKNPVKEIKSIIIKKSADDIFTYITGTSFLHNQVRIIMGNLRQVGNKTKNPEFIKELLKLKDRTLGAQTAPPDGLYLTAVKY